MDELTEAEREALGIWDDGSYACANDDYTCERCDPERDHESLLGAVARIKADAHAAGVAEGRAEIAAAVNALVSGWESWGGQVSQECAAMARDALADPHDYRDDATAIGDSTGYGGPVGGGRP